MGDIFKIAGNAINLAKVAEAMQKHLLHSPSFNYKFLPQMSYVLFFHHSAQSEAGEHAKSERRLENLKHVEWNGTTLRVMETVAFVQWLFPC